MNVPPQKSHTAAVSRRAILGGTLATLSLSGCGFMSLEPRVPEVPLEFDPGQKEAPTLAARVKAGELPPVAERLPKSPEVIEPTERPGGYGGTWRSGMLGAISIFQAYTHAASDALMRWNEDFSKPTPNIAESVKVSDGGSTFTFKIRDGLRWSDGAPLTSDDLIFAYDEVMSHPDLGIAPTQEYVVDGKTGSIEKIDDLTFVFKFAGPNGLFLSRMASPNGYILTMYPKHYLTRFHKDHNAGVKQEAEDAGFASWADYFYSKVGRGYWDLPRWQTTELPTIACWIVKVPFGESSRLTLVRNPYCYKVDPAGRQLPYMEEVELEVIGNAELMTIQTSNGQMTLPQSDITTLTNKPVFAANRESGNYHFVPAVSTEQNQISLQFNLNAKNKQLKEIFRERDFRIAMSKAINRQEIIDAVYQRQGEPWQLAPRRESPFYDEEMAKQFTELDLDGANELLDGIGLDKRSSNGLRLGPDGNPVTFDMAVQTQQPTWISTLNLVSAYWREVGIRMRVQSMDRSLFYQRKGVNELDAAVWSAAGGLLDAMYDPRLWMPQNSECLWAPLWAEWYATNGESGERPIKSVREEMELYRAINKTTDLEEQKALFKKLMDIAKREFFTVGVCLPVGAYTIVQNDFHNFPDNYIASWTYPTPGPLHPEQFFQEAK